MPTTERSKRSGKAFTPRSNEEKTTQTSGTPREFLAAVEKQFGVKLTFDLACTQENCIAFEDRIVKVNADCVPDPNGAFEVGSRRKFGYFHDLGVDALARNWNEEVQLPEGQASWLNNEYTHIEPWVRKCCHTLLELERRGKGSRCFQLIPAGTGTNWFYNYVAGMCDRYYLSPRMSFIDPGTGEPFKKWNEKKNLWQPMGINRDLMLLDWKPRPLLHGQRLTNTFCWNWKTGALKAA